MAGLLIRGGMRHALSSRIGSALIALATAFATVAAPVTFNYGGHLVQNGTPVSGNADFQFRLFNAPTGGALVNANPPTVSTTLTGGDFSTPVDLTALGGLASIQDDSRVLQGGWVEVAVRRPGEQNFTPLLPRQQFSAVPGALFAESTAHEALADQVAPAAIGHAQIAPGSIQPDSLLAGTVVRSLNGLTDSVQIVAGTGVTLTSANGAITISSTGGSVGAVGWSLTGNGGVTDDQFLGTTDLHPLTLKVNGVQAVRYEFGQSTDFGNNPPNVIGGMANNSAGPGTYGSFIGTGSFITNGSFFSFIGGGSGLLLGTNSPWSAMVGGFNNILSDNSNGSFIGGGLDLRIYNSTGAVMAGGTDNTITNSGGAFIGGGQNNLISPDVSGSSTLLAVITGGGHNTINGSSYASIGGGAYNTVDFGGYIGTIAGGQQNQITNAGWSTIAGGLGNKVVVSNGGAAIGGGAYNQVGLGNGTFYSAGYATVPGGYGNIAAGEYSFAAGLYAQATNNGTFVWSDSLAGQFDRFSSVTANEFAVRARGGVRFDTGGKGLTVDGISFNPAGNGFSLGDGAITVAKLSAPNPQPGQFLSLDGNGALQWVSAPGGGGPAGNAWQLGGNAGTTTGQFLGTTDAQPLELRASGQTGLRLSAAANASGETGVNVVGGFGGNSVAAGATGATIGGGGFKEANGVVHPNQALGSYATVAGGFDNLGGDVGTVVGGGSRNRTTDQYATVAGGLQNSALGNSATVAGGFNNQAGSAKGLFAAVGGGANNTASGEFAAIPGGSLNQATGVSAFAAGHRALATHDGSFVWADGTDANFGSTTPNEFAVRAHGGVRIDTGGRGLTVDGALITPGGANPVTSVNVSAAGSGKNAVEAHAKVGAIAIHGISDDAAANTYAAQFDGNVNMTGTLNVNGNIVASHVQVLGNLQVNDVAAQTVTARGLVGNPGTPDGTALSVKSGGIQVLGAGNETPTAVYRHIDDGTSQIDRQTSNTVFGGVDTTSLGIILNHPMLNGHPEVFVLFSENGTHYGGIDQLAYVAAYRSDLGRWTITHHGNNSGVRGHYDGSVWAIMIIKP